jgi:hypothetical protein
MRTVKGRGRFSTSLIRAQVEPSLPERTPSKADWIASTRGGGACGHVLRIANAGSG